MAGVLLPLMPLPITPSETPSPTMQDTKLQQQQQQQQQQQHPSPTAPTTAPTVTTSPTASQQQPKSNPARPIRNRPRRERPCDACRRRKTRCVMTQGNALCAFCQFHSKECTFVQEPLPRTRKSKDFDELADGENGPRQTAQHVPSQCFSRQSYSLRSQSPPNHQDFMPDLCQHIAGFDTDILQNMDFAADSFDMSNFKLESTAYPLQDALGLEASPQASRIADNLQADELRMILAPYGRALVDLYFRFVHTDFPILSEQEFLARFHNPITHDDVKDNSHAVLLAAISLAALPFWDHSPSLMHLVPPQTQQLEELVYWSVFHFPAPTSLETVQAGLLLLQRPAFRAWNLTCQLVALGQSIGLHLDCTGWSGLDEADKSVRRRTAWALYLQDKWSALVHTSPSHIHDESDWTVSPLSVEDFLDIPFLSEDFTQPCIIFRQMVTLTMIVSSILRTVQCAALTHSLPKQGGTADTTRIILAAAKPIQMQLKSWFASLPAAAKLDTPTGGAVGSLHLAYYAAEITLHRRIISSMIPPAAVDPYLCPILRLAAKSRLISAMDFVNRLRPQHLTTSFWYMPSASNLALVATFGSLLRSTSQGGDERAFYTSRLQEYRWTLGVSWGRAEWLRTAVELLDSQMAAGMMTTTTATTTEDYIGHGQLPTPPCTSEGQERQVGDRHSGSHPRSAPMFGVVEAAGTQQLQSTRQTQEHLQQPRQHTSASLAELRASLGLGFDEAGLELDGSSMDDDENYSDDFVEETDSNGFEGMCVMESLVGGAADDHDYDNDDYRNDGDDKDGDDDFTMEIVDMKTEEKEMAASE